MATLAPPTSSSSSPTSFHRRRKSWARKLERCCCSTLAYFPLVFVYGLTTWAVITEVRVSLLAGFGWFALVKAALGVALYGLANSSYSIAVFTPPGSPLDPRQDLSVGRKRAGAGGRGAYDVLPTHEHEHDVEDGETDASAADMTTVTAKSTGKARYCKKCHTLKPDRTHHCSTCGRCVLKMDHHCPWLATCVGLRNYKAFLLFLIYTSLFCWLCFAVTASWVWAAIRNDSRMHEGLVVVNTILLAVLGGIIGLVLSGFTAWHVYLVLTGQTTIESLEKTRYLSPLRKSMERSSHQQQHAERHYLADDAEAQDGEQGPSLLDQLKETHANALPGVLRPEEGEATPSRSVSHSPQPSSSSPAKDSLQRTYASLEHQREHDRYTSYLDEVDSEKLPNAFNLGRTRNFLHVFGHEPLCWFLPILNTSGDGWSWEVSPQWTEARAEQSRQREQRAREEAQWGASAQGVFEPPRSREWRWAGGQGFVDRNGAPQHSHPQHQVEQDSGAGRNMQMQPLDRRKGPPPSNQRSGSDADSYDTSSDEEMPNRRNELGRGAATTAVGTANWNDIPDDFLTPRANGNGNGNAQRSGSRGRKKGD